MFPKGEKDERLKKPTKCGDTKKRADTAAIKIINQERFLTEGDHGIVGKNSKKGIDKSPAGKRAFLSL